MNKSSSKTIPPNEKQQVLKINPI